jgi:hypothetical protein
MPTTRERLGQLDDFERVETVARERQWDEWRARIASTLAEPCTRQELVTRTVPLITAFAGWALHAGYAAGELRRERRRFTQAPDAPDAPDGSHEKAA